jgi:hypothetical protein
MKINRSIIVLVAILTAPMIDSAQEVSIDQIKQMIEESAVKLTTYTYSRSAQSNILYTNESTNTSFNADKVTQGRVDLANQSGWWGSNLTDKNSSKVLTWEGYFVNGSEYWKEGQNWTKFEINDTARIMEDYNEIPGQVVLINYSNMRVVGSEIIGGVDSYKLVGSPMEMIYKGMIGLQLIAAYLPSPFPLPKELRNQTLNINNTSLMNNSNIVVTAWVSKNDSLLRRLDINSTLTITPEILNISSSDFKIVSALNESTVYEDFGSPMKIALPKGAQNASNRMIGTDWRWAVFGSIRP